MKFKPAGQNPGSLTLAAACLLASFHSLAGHFPNNHKSTGDKQHSCKKLVTKNSPNTDLNDLSTAGSLFAAAAAAAATTDEAAMFAILGSEMNVTPEIKWRHFPVTWKK